MNPQRLRLRNVRRFAELDLELPATRTAILGQNGAGKSTILDSIEVALFGGDLAAMLSIDATLPELEIELTFEHQDVDYRVRRGYSARGARGKPTLDFEAESVELGWVPLTRETIAATQDLICETLRLTRQTYRASAYLAQGDSGAFTEAKPAERKQILAEVLALADYDQLLVRARLEKNTIEASIARTRMQLEHAERDQADLAPVTADLEAQRNALAGVRERLAELEALTQQAGEQLAAAREAQVRHETALETRTACDRALREAQTRAADLDRELDQISQALQGREDLAIAASELDALEQQRDEIIAGRQRAISAYQERQRLAQQAERDRQRHASLVADLERVQRQRDEAQADGERAASAEAPTCQTCGQPVADEARLRMLEALRRRVDDIDHLCQDAATAAGDAAADVQRSSRALNEAADVPVVTREQVEEATQRVDAARAAQRRLAEIDAQAARITALERDLAFQRDEAIPHREQALAEADALVAEHAAAAAGYEEARRAHTLTQDGLRDQRDVESAMTSRLARLEEQAERLARLDTQISDARREIDQAQAQLDVAVALERAFGRDGIPTMIVENAAIPQIETEANRILSELDTVYSVELRTQRALKTSDGVRETLDITVQTPDGERAYETFSGGERGRLNIALRIALARLLAHRRGAEIRLLAIDEPEGLDSAGAERLAQVLDGLADDFDVVLLVTHQEAMREAFDSSLTIVGGASTGEPSRLADALAPSEAIEELAT